MDSAGCKNHIIQISLKKHQIFRKVIEATLNEIWCQCFRRNIGSVHCIISFNISCLRLLEYCITRSNSYTRLLIDRIINHICSKYYCYSFLASKQESRFFGSNRGNRIINNRGENQRLIKILNTTKLSSTETALNTQKILKHMSIL